MQYTITAVSQQTRNYDTKYGSMTSYKVKLDGVDEPVELSQKASTAAPQQGATLNGTIEQGNYGPKFKKEFNQGGGFAQPQSQQAASSPNFGQSGLKNKPAFDNYTMYLSYAKDIAVALVEAKTPVGELEEAYADLLDLVEKGGKTLYNARPGQENVPEKKDTLPKDEDVEKPINMDAFDMVFGDNKKGDDVVPTEPPF